jgi:glyceraldehyde-3-phosphate dehydrogenase/erythrose-4-phosphate dehydrogenase
MKSFVYEIQFQSELGQVKAITVMAACTGNAIAIAWSRLTDEVGSTQGWAITRRFAA